MAKRVKPIPSGYSIVTPYLVVDGAVKALRFYKKVFGAKELHRMPGPKGKIIHAELRIGDSIVMLSDAISTGKSRSPKALGGTAVRLLLYSSNVDRTFRKAVAAGAKGEIEPHDMFWGDRYARISDPFGHRWDLATHVEDVPPQEVLRRQKALFAKPGKK